MKKEDLDLIKKQTNIIDDLEIERVYIKNDYDIVKTIMELSDLKPENDKIRHTTLFDDLRQICDEKDKIFQSKLKRN